MDLLNSGGKSVSRLAESFAVSRPAISQHLRVLLEAGLVAEERQGREHFYRLQGQRLAEVQAWVSQYEQFWHQKLDALGQYLDENQNSEEV